LTKRTARDEITIMLILSHFDAVNAPAMAAPVSRLWLFFSRRTAKKQRISARDPAVILAAEPSAA
jgi:hypothetical protein